jgi:hypothetical protein
MRVITQYAFGGPEVLTMDPRFSPSLKRPSLNQFRLKFSSAQETFSFERIADARRLMEEGHLQGKVVLTV